MGLQLFRTWRLSVEARLERQEPIRVEVGRVRRALQKAGALLDHVRNKDQPERRLGFLTNRIISALETGTPPWHKPWDSLRTGNPCIPRNAAAGARYHGINA